MQIAGQRISIHRLSRRVSRRTDPPAIAAWTLAFALVAYLAFSDGGYDTVVRGEVGIAVWWIVLFGAVVALIPARLGRAAWTAIGLLGAFAAWTALGIGWSESAERSTIELARVATYLGVLIIAVAAQGRSAARHTINGVACAIGLVTALAVLSRVHPQWFPDNAHISFLTTSARKLSYPLNYWNALAGFAAMGVPLLVAVALSARTLAGRAAAAAVLPLSGLCMYLTVSRGGPVALGVGLVVFLALAPRRPAVLSTLAVGGIGAAILVAAASQRDALQAGLPTPAALDQGDEMLVLSVIVCAGVALVQVALGLAARHIEIPAALTPSKRITNRRLGAALAVALVVAVAAGLPGQLRDDWREFKRPVPTANAGLAESSDLFSRLQGANGNGRYQFWQSATDAMQEHPLNGIGPGTFEYWWAQHATTDGFVRDAHSLWFQTLAELGLVGLALLAGLFAWLVGVAVRRCRAARRGLRLQLAAATGALAAFLLTASVEWAWQMGAIAAAVMVLGAVIVSGRDEVLLERETRAPVPPVRDRAIVAGLAVAAIVVILLPLMAARGVRDSRAAVNDGRLAAALHDARSAGRAQPYAATPHLQQALVLERAGDLRAAAAAAASATHDESTNWRTWLTRARIDARLGHAEAALAELRRARSLNPRSPLWKR